MWGAIMAEGDNWHVVEPREITVLDRIGGGDGFLLLGVKSLEEIHDAAF